MDIYYRIWMDLITRLRSIETNKKDWQIKGMVCMSTAMTFNFAFLLAIIQRNILGKYFYEINIQYIPEYINDILTLLLLFVLPCVLINYLLIFYNKRYESFEGKYPYHQGKLAAAYILLSMFIPFLLLCAG